MRQFSEMFDGHGWRLLFGLPCLGIGAYFVITAEADKVDVLRNLVFAAPFALGGAIILAPLIIEFLAEPFRALFYSGERADRPGPMYGIPQSKRAKGLYEEAMAGFRKIAQDHPGELRAYLEMLDMAVHNLKDPDRAKSVLFEALAHLEKEADRRTIQKMFDMQIERLAPPPEWLQELAEQRLKPPKIDPALPVDEPDGRTARRFHPGGFNRYEGPDADGFVDTRPKIPRKKRGGGSV